jgi:hypothetical protein
LTLTADRRQHEIEEWLPGPGGAASHALLPALRRPAKAGILAFIAAALARQGVNLDALLQEPGYPKDNLPFVITLEACPEAALQAALAEIGQSDWHASPPLALPMLVGGDS